MARKKVRLEWIANDSARTLSMRKRRGGLLKKVSELSTLCGVDAFAIIYSPDEREPAFWPSRSEVHRLLMRFRGTSEVDRANKMISQESYLKDRIGKGAEQFKKFKSQIKEMRMSYYMQEMCEGQGVDNFGIDDLLEFINLVEDKKDETITRVEYLQRVPPLPPAITRVEYLQQVPPVPPMFSYFPPYQGSEESDLEEIEHFVSGNAGNDICNDQWFIDMLKKSKNVAAGSSHANGDVISPQANINGGNSDVGAKIEGGWHLCNNDGTLENIVSSGMRRGNPGGNISTSNTNEIGLPHGDIGAGNNGGNSFDQGLTGHGNIERGTRQYLDLLQLPMN